MTQRISWLGTATLAGALALSAGMVWSQNIPGILENKGDVGTQRQPADSMELDPLNKGSGVTAGSATSDLKKAQEALKEKGHDPGPIDGVLGPRTKEALRDFQAASGLQPTGSLDAKTAAKLGLEKSMPFGGRSVN